MFGWKRANRPSIRSSRKQPVVLNLESLEDRMLLNANFGGQPDDSPFMADLTRFGNNLEKSAITLLNAAYTSAASHSAASQWSNVANQLSAEWNQMRQDLVQVEFAVLGTLRQELDTLVQDAESWLNDLSMRLRGQPSSTTPTAGNTSHNSSAEETPNPILVNSPLPATAPSATKIHPLFSPPPPPPPPPPPVVSMSTSSGNGVQEGFSSAQIVATLNYPNYTQAVSVQFNTSDGTATAGKDYTATSGSLTFQPGSTTASATIPIIDDKAVNEPQNETFYATLSNPSGATLGSQTTATLTIQEDSDGGANLPPVAVAGDNLCNCGGPNESGSLKQDAASKNAPAPKTSTNDPVRYADGVVTIAQTDLHSDGFGFPWGQTRSWTNGPGYATGSDNGSGWVDTYIPHLIQADGSTNNTLIFIANGNTAYYYDLVNGVYQPRIDDGSKLTYNSSNDSYTLIDTSGNSIVFDGFGTSWLSAQRG